MKKRVSKNIQSYTVSKKYWLYYLQSFAGLQKEIKKMSSQGNNIKEKDKSLKGSKTRNFRKYSEV